MWWRGWDCVTHCACHCKVNSLASLLVTEAMICSAGCLGGVGHMGEAFACQVACGERANPVENRNVFCPGMEGGGCMRDAASPKESVIHVHKER